MSERMTRGLRALVLLLGVLGFAFGPAAGAATPQRAVPAAAFQAAATSATAVPNTATATAAASTADVPAPAVAQPDVHPAQADSASVGGTPHASTVVQVTAASVSGAAVLVTKPTARTRTATKVLSPRQAKPGAPGILPGHAATGAGPPLIGTADDIPASPRQVTPLTPRGRGPPSITGS